MAEQAGKITHEKLTTVTESEAIEIINYHLSSLPGPDVKSDLIARLYLDELVRRSQDKATKRMLCLTWVIAALTVVLVFGLGVQIWLAFKGC